jgi:hypothetical protein
MTIRPRIGIILTFLIGSSTLLHSSVSQAQELEPIKTSTVEIETLTFAEGPATRFGSTVNGRTHQQSPLISHRGYQYAAYVDAKRRICIARRKLPSGSWETIHFEDHHFETNDSHNSVVIGICETDGTIHMAFDHHASRLNYRVSKPDAASDPESAIWNQSLFSEVLHTLGSVRPEDRITYPRFFNAPNGNLMLYYRAVTSANGDGMIEEYNGNKHDWTPGLGKFIARDIDTFTVNGATSRYRCPYLNSISYSGTRLHVSWIWRDLFEKTNARNQHSLCYVYSDDDGRTWHNSAGKVVGETGKTFIHLNTPGLVASEISTNQGLSNQNTHYAYPDGSIHIVMLHRSKGSSGNPYQHHWRTPGGIWNQETLPFSGTRPKLVGAEDRSLILVYTSGDQLRIAKGVPNSDKSHWQWSNIKLPQAQSCYGDALLDLDRWDAENVLSIYCQEEPSKTIQTKESNPIDGIPSPLKVVDFRLK